MTPHMTKADPALLCVPLPDDIARLKQAGQLQLAREWIAHRLAEDSEGSYRLPALLRDRLLLEQEILERLPLQYPYTKREALQRLRAAFAGFRDEELSELMQDGAVEWIYLEGEIRFHSLFLQNIGKTRPDYRLRKRDGASPDTADAETALLRETIRRAKAEGSARQHIHLCTTIRLTEEGINKCRGKHIRVYLPLPVEYAQVRDFRLLSISPAPAVIAPSRHPQRTAVFETDCTTGEESFSAEFSFDNVIEYRDPDPAGVREEQPAFDTGEQLPHIRFTPYLRALCSEIVGEEQSPLRKVRRIYDFITTKVRYSYVRSYSTFDNIPEFTAASLKGDCGFQALLFITLCRITGIPARWQSGLIATPYSAGSHDWAQYYIAPYGWLFADCSYGGAAYRQGDEERRRFYGANIDPYRVPQASAFQHAFCVPEKALRYDPYDNQVGEIICEGKALAAYGADFSTSFQRT